jgi:hypothetical protein
MHEPLTGFDDKAVHETGVSHAKPRKREEEKARTTNWPSEVPLTIASPIGESLCAILCVSASWREMRRETARFNQTMPDLEVVVDLTRLIANHRLGHAQCLPIIDIRAFAEIINAPIASGRPF